MAKSKAALAAPSAPKPIAEAGKKLKKLKADKKKTEDKLKEINKAIVELETITLQKLMADNEMESVRIAGVGTLYTTDEVYVSVLKDDRPKLYAWAREKGHGDMIGDWIFPNTLSAFVKRQLEDQAEQGVNDGNTLPGFVKVTNVPTVNLRSAK